MTTQDLLYVAGLMVAICGGFSGILWAMLRHRFERLEKAVDDVWKKMVSVDVCNARERRVNDVADSLTKRLDRVEARID